MNALRWWLSGTGPAPWVRERPAWQHAACMVAMGAGVVLALWGAA